ncbi:MAG: TRAM domain-containing protein [Armatimonadota bacterium]|nr:TRAM domain-containing protein [Armatimonadota bacterium]
MTRVVRLLGAILGGVILFQLAEAIQPFLPEVPLLQIGSVLAATLVGGIAGFLGAPSLWRRFTGFMARVLHLLSGVSLRDLTAGVLGLIVGLLVSFLVSYPLSRIPLVGTYLQILAILVFGYLGVNLAIHHREDLLHLLFRGERPSKDRLARWRNSPKILDTSAIIDGRIADVYKTGFLEGPLLVPRFVLVELQRIADSSDPLRRNRGRRGLEILNSLQKELQAVQIYEGEEQGSGDTDALLVKLAKRLKGAIITSDFNLHKVAEIEGVRVLNINELANALKPILLPGEEISVHVIREGKEAGQGVGYLDDGTMIVVEGGKKFIGETPEVVVTSILQTAAGRMIFTRPKVQDRESVSK